MSFEYLPLELVEIVKEFIHGFKEEFVDSNNHYNIRYKNSKGLIHGNWKIWFTDTITNYIYTDSNYFDGKLHGQYKEWWPTPHSKRILRQLHFNFKEKDKWWDINDLVPVDDNKILRKEIFYSHGLYNGTFKEWDINNKRLKEHKYKNGHRTGIWKTWSSYDGHLISYHNYTPICAKHLCNKYAKYGFYCYNHREDKPMCATITKRNKPCKNPAKYGNYCGIHKII